MKTSYLASLTIIAIFAVFQVTVPAHATGDYSTCKPGSYNADQCAKAHARDDAVDLMDLANHALAAGDKVAAFGAWSLAALSDKNPAAMNKLGFALYFGNGAPQSIDAAIKWFQKAAALGDPEGQSNLATIYLHGTGLDQDFTRALDLSRRGAEAGYAPAQTNYGHMLYTGKGTDVDYDAAEKWTRKAAVAGGIVAKSNLGEMYEKGHGVPRDIELAKKWYGAAAAEGYQSAIDGLARIDRMAAVTNAERSSVVDLANEALESGHHARAAQILKAAPFEANFDAELRLANWRLDQNQMREAVYWLDRAHISANGEGQLSDLEEAHRKYHEKLLPQPMAGWVVHDVVSGFASNPVEAAHLTDADLVFVTYFERLYENEETNQQYLLSIMVNFFPNVANALKVIATDSGNTNVVIKIGAKDAVIAYADNYHRVDGIIIPLSSSIQINLDTTMNSGAAAPDLDTLTAALGAMDFDQVTASVAGHGHYKKDAAGRIYRP